MRYLLTKSLLLAMLAAVSAPASAGLRDWCRRDAECGDGCTSQCCPTMCVPECKSVTVKKHCWNTECEQVCIPPVTLPCCKCLFGGKANGGCCDSGCGGDGCGGCGSGCSKRCCKNSLLQRLFSRCAGCRTRCVTRLKKHEYECEKTVVEWKCVPCGGCGDGCGTGCCDTGACCEPGCCAPPRCAAPACCAPGGCQ